MILKAGTYRFNGEVELLSSATYTLNFTCALFNSSINLNSVAHCNSIVFDIGSNFSYLKYSIVSLSPEHANVSSGNHYVYSSTGGWSKADYGDLINTITLETDQDVDDTFGEWFTSSAEVVVEESKPIAEIIYNGETIAQLNAGETATLPCKETVMASDLVVKVNEGAGNCSGEHVIEVEELPSENIDANAIYKISGSFSDVLVYVSADMSMSYVELAAAEGVACSCNTIPTKTSSGIKITNLASDSTEPSIHFYYIKDENDVFMYGDIEGTGTNDWISFSAMMGGSFLFQGTITDVSEASVQGYYAVGEDAKYYRYGLGGGKAFADLILQDGDTTMSYKESTNTTFHFRYETTRPTSDILESTDTDTYLYYIEDENIVTTYENGDWTTTFAVTVISNKNEISEDGFYAVIQETSGWLELGGASGSLTITENGTFDVSGKAGVVVAVDRIIKVSTLPTSDIKTDAFYRCGGALYRYIESEACGTWVLNNEIVAPSGCSMVFECDGVIYTGLYQSLNEYAYYYNYVDGKDINLTTYWWMDMPSGWVDKKYKTITVLECDSEDALTWLKANGTKTVEGRGWQAVYGNNEKLYQYKTGYNSTKGTWVFNDKIDLPELYSICGGGEELYPRAIINFVSDGTAYTSFRCFVDDGLYYYDEYDNGPLAYRGDDGTRWQSDVLQSVVINDNTPVYNSLGDDITSSFISWLEANATNTNPDYIQAEYLRFIEVDELPTTDIKANVIYKCNEKLYTYNDDIVGTWMLNETMTIPSSAISAYDSNVKWFNLLYPDLVNWPYADGCCAIRILADGTIYYDESLGDLFVKVYADGTWVNDTYRLINITSEPSDDALVSFKKYLSSNAVKQNGWTEYIIPEGSLTVTENSTVDVTDKKEVIVNVPTYLTVSTEDEALDETTIPIVEGQIIIVEG